MKIIFTLIVGSVLGPLTLLFVLVINGLLDDTINWINALTGFFKYVYPIGFVGAIIIGIPCYFFLKHFNSDNYFTLAGEGLVGGAIIGTTAKPILGSMLLYGGSGFMVASGFWFFSVFLPSKVISKIGSKSLNQIGANDAPPG